MPRRTVYRNGRPVSINVLPNITMPNIVARRPTAPRPTVRGNAGYPVGFGVTDNTLDDATAPTGGRFNNALNNYDYFGGMDANTPSPSGQDSGSSWSPLGRAGSLGSMGGMGGRYFGGQEGGASGSVVGNILGTMAGNSISGGDFALSPRQAGSILAPLISGSPYAALTGGVLGGALAGEGVNPASIIQSLALKALGPLGLPVGMGLEYTGAGKYLRDGFNNTTDNVLGTSFGPNAKINNDSNEMQRAMDRHDEVGYAGYSPFLPDNSIDTTVQPLSNADSLYNQSYSALPDNSIDTTVQSLNNVYSETGPEWNGSTIGNDVFDNGNGNNNWGSSDPMWDLPNNGFNDSNYVYDNWSGNYDSNFANSDLSVFPGRNG